MVFGREVPIFGIELKSCTTCCHLPFRLAPFTSRGTSPQPKNNFSSKKATSMSRKSKQEADVAVLRKQIEAKTSKEQMAKVTDEMMLMMGQMRASCGT